MDVRLFNGQETFYQERLQQLKDVRYSFARTPIVTGKHIVSSALRAAGGDPTEPVTWTLRFQVLLVIIFYFFLTLLSLMVVCGYAICLATLANLSSNGYRLRRPPLEQVKPISIGLGAVHLGLVLAVLAIFDFDTQLTYPKLLMASLIVILSVILSVLAGSTILVAGWKMLKMTSEMLYWPSNLKSGEA